MDGKEHSADWTSVVTFRVQVIWDPISPLLFFLGKEICEWDGNGLAKVQSDLFILYLLASHIHSEGKNSKKYPSLMGVEAWGFGSGAFFLVLNTQVNKTLFPLFSVISKSA